MDNIKNIIKQNKWFISFLFVLLFSRLFIFSPFKVEGASMQPSLYSGERGVYLKNSKIDNSDIIVLNDITSDKNLIKRVIGIPGDQINLEKDLIRVNGKVLKEPYLIRYPEGTNINLTEQEFIVPDDFYFVLGDNRLNSTDSRQLGFINQKDIKGKVVTTFGLKLY